MNKKELVGWTIMPAYEAEQIQEGVNTFLVLSNGFRYKGIAGKKGYQVLHYQRYGIRLPKMKFVEDKKYTTLSTSSLWRLRKDKKAAAELHWRLAFPPICLGISLVGCASKSLKAKVFRNEALVLSYHQLYFLFTSLTNR